MTADADAARSWRYESALQQCQRRWNDYLAGLVAEEPECRHLHAVPDPEPRRNG